MTRPLPLLSRLREKYPRGLYCPCPEGLRNARCALSCPLTVPKEAKKRRSVAKVDPAESCCEDERLSPAQHGVITTRW